VETAQGLGYEVSIRAGHLVIGHVLYVDSERRLRCGMLVSSLNVVGDTTARPKTHVVTFAGLAPCDKDGNVLGQILHSSGRQILADGLEVDHTFSSKPASGYTDYHHKMTTHAGMLAGPAQVLDPAATATMFHVITCRRRGLGLPLHRHGVQPGRDRRSEREAPRRDL
jgi:hypothetical protein